MSRDYYDDGYRHGRGFYHECPDTGYEGPESDGDRYDYDCGIERGDCARRWNSEWDDND